MTYSIQKFATTAIATTALLISTTTGIFAATVDVSGNGYKSINTVKISNNCVSGVSQGNQTLVVNDISSSANTGGNSAKSNTGADVTVHTGDASSSVSVTVAGGNNTATAPSCCDCVSSVDIMVNDNGAKAKNKVVLNNSRETYAEQVSVTEVQNLIKSKAVTGKNVTSKNTGKYSSVKIKTGSSDSVVEVAVIGGSNVLQ